MSERTILILAAGASRRMARRDKLLELIDGIPLILRQSLAALQVAPKVIVTLPPDRPERLNALLPVQDRIKTVLVNDADSGMSASFRAVADAQVETPLMVLPCDMPDLTAEHLEAVWQAAEKAPSSILRATTEDGRPGHPVVFPNDLVPLMKGLTGDEGARSILQAHKHRIRKTPLPGEAAVTDLDTPEAWEDWRKRNAH